MRVPAGFTIAVVCACCALAQAQPVDQVRCRVKEKVVYHGFGYSGKNWLVGAAVGLSDDTLVVKMELGRELVPVGLRNITELQYRSGRSGPWQTVSMPVTDANALREQLGIGASPVHAGGVPAATDPRRVGPGRWRPWRGTGRGS